MQHTEKPLWLRVIVAVNSLLICLLLLFGVMLICLTVSCTPDPEAGRAFLWERQGEPVLLLLESGESSHPGDEVLVRGTMDGETVYTLEPVQENRDEVLLLGENGAVYEESIQNIAGQVSFESQLFGRLVSYVSDPEHAGGVVVLCLAAGLFLLFLILATVFLSLRYGRAAPQPPAPEEKGAAMLADDAFLHDVYTQEINEPEELVSIGDDETPVTQEELERFRETVLKS